MRVMASQITGVSIVCSTICLGADQRKYKSSASLVLEGNPPISGEFPLQRASNAENVSIWWRHDVVLCFEFVNVSVLKRSGWFNYPYPSGLFHTLKLMSARPWNQLEQQWQRTKLIMAVRMTCPIVSSRVACIMLILSNVLIKTNTNL